MTIEDLDLYVPDDLPIQNRTRAYIVPCLRKHGKKFLNAINKYSFVGAGVFDTQQPDYYDGTTVGYLINARDSDTTKFKDIPYLKGHYYFGEMLYGQLHMLVIKLPEDYHLAIHAFVLGKYSKMYDKPGDVFNKSSTSAYFNHVKIKCLQVCKKSEKYRKKLEEELGVYIPKGNELDDLIDPTKEVFNHSMRPKLWKRRLLKTSKEK